PAAIAAAAEAERNAGATTIVAGTAVIAVRARRVVAIAVVVRPVVMVAPVAMVVMIATPMTMAVARTDVSRGLRSSPRLRCISRRSRLHRIVGSVGCGTSHQRRR